MLIRNLNSFFQTQHHLSFILLVMILWGACADSSQRSTHQSEPSELIPESSESSESTESTPADSRPTEASSIEPTVASKLDRVTTPLITVRPIVAPLLETTWGQSGLYQTQTPMRGLEPTYPGCTTIASAQILYYYQYQDHAQSEVYYTLEHQPLSGEGVVVEGQSIYLDLPNHRYDYQAMALHLEEASPEEIEATATFIFHVGATMNAQFGGGEGSSATGRQIENAFRYQWGFNHISRRQMSIISKDAFQYNDKEWSDLIRTELNAGRPVLYMALQEGGDAGHAFVIDGYDESDRVHVNFGWGGYANGWYDLHTLEDPSGRRWIKNPLIFRGLEPEPGYASMLKARPQDSSARGSEVTQYAWSGNTSVISYISEELTGYGLTVDEGFWGALIPSPSVIFTQWEVDQRDGTRLKFSAEGVEKITLTYGPWNDRTQDRIYRDVKLPFILNPELDQLSVTDGEYYVIAVTLPDTPHSDTTLLIEPTSRDLERPLTDETRSREAPPIFVEGHAWSGNGSLISFASDEQTGYGLTIDEVMIHPTAPAPPAVFFQWEIDPRDGQRLKIEAEGMAEAKIRYGIWNDRTQDVIRTMTLPAVLDPVAEGMSAEDGEYYVIMVSFDQIPQQSISVIATPVQ